MEPTTFEQYWLKNRQRLLNENQEYREAIEGYKMKSGADWLLFAMPVVAALLVFDWNPFGRELLNWIISALVAIICFAACVAVKSWLSVAACVAVKSWLSGGRPISEIEADIKEQARREFENAQHQQ